MRIIRYNAVYIIRCNAVYIIIHCFFENCNSFLPSQHGENLHCVLLKTCCVLDAQCSFFAVQVHNSNVVDLFFICVLLTDANPIYIFIAR